jgi:hypothetical protein
MCLTPEEDDAAGRMEEQLLSVLGDVGPGSARSGWPCNV